MLLAPAQLSIGLARATRVYVVGAFSNTFLPTGFGGDAVRAVLIARPGPPLVRALVSVLTDRASALATSVLLAWVAVVVEPQAIPEQLVVVLAVVSGAGALAGALAVVLARRGRVASFLPELLRGWATAVLELLATYSRDRPLILRLLIYGLVYQALVVLALWLLSEAIDAEISAAVLAVVTPLVLIATLLPISIAGFGVREGAFVALLGEVGVSSTEATLLSLLSVAAFTVAALPGAAALIAGDLRPPRPEEIEARLAGAAPAEGNGAPPSDSAHAQDADEEPRQHRLKAERGHRHAWDD